MSSSLRAAPDGPPELKPTTSSPASATPQTMRVTQELPMLSMELGEALLEEQATLRCEVLLWQRWVRYLALGAMVLLSIVFSTTVQDALWPLGLIAAGYVGVVLS